ncbi:hypothetical protein I0C86_38175 [Plantactinospora sp. S1510]|uniref:Uncharacterized protein n=1 Tax=Plantactinospora alkalitolerans TaxID=2789879 RepID=A0ABS0H8B3_9ACTN|nr:hypothetical protein [Plantactinospora alkalitolerans]MBF9134717.1 hypothetical protein [Plantactinospora alkalitolerans]
MDYIRPNAEQLIEVLTETIRRHDGNPVMQEGVLIDIGGARVPVDFVELMDITEDCQWPDCHCAYGQKNPPEDAPTEGVHFAVVIGGDFP